MLSEYYEYFVNGELVLVRAMTKKHALAALRKRYGFDAEIEERKSSSAR